MGRTWEEEKKDKEIFRLGGQDRTVNASPRKHFVAHWKKMSIFAANIYCLMEIRNLMTFKDREALRRWLEEHHLSERECWVATYRSKLPLPDALPYLEVVEESLCFGWIDSTVKKMEDGRLAQRISPRRKKSHWTELNLLRCHDLESRGLMTDAGRNAYLNK